MSPGSRANIGFSIPQTSLEGDVGAARVRAFLERAEALGIHSVWVADQKLPELASLEAVELLAYAAAVTDRLRLGAAMLLTVLHSPVHLAKSLTTLDHLSRGRLIIGVALGADRYYPAYGIPPERRAARFTEGLRIMKALWTEARVTVAGEFCQLADVAMEPKPVQTPHPPIWFGGHHPSALRRAVQLGDGFLGAGASSTARFAEEARAVRSFLEAGGRDRERFTIGKRVYVAVDRDKARAGARLAKWFGSFYRRPQLAAEVAVCGGVDECLDGLAAVRAAGGEFLLLNPVFDDSEQLEILASEIVPKL